MVTMTDTDFITPGEIIEDKAGTRYKVKTIHERKQGVTGTAIDVEIVRPGRDTLKVGDVREVGSDTLWRMLQGGTAWKVKDTPAK